MQQDFSRIFYRLRTIRFRCTCEKFDNLTQNSLFIHNMRHVSVRWCGDVADQAFTLLGKCVTLEKLFIHISKSTLLYRSDRAIRLRNFFPLS